LSGLTVTSTSATTATVTFTAPTLPPGTIAPSTVTLTVTATNAGGTSSAPGTMTVTITPVPDNITITTAQYRLAQQRLNINATSTVVSPNVVLTVQPYLVVDGTIYDPSLTVGATMTNTGAGAYTYTAIGVPEPAVSPARPIVVKSNLGGASPATAITVR
jgi:hypothetical protein